MAREWAAKGPWGPSRMEGICRNVSPVGTSPQANVKANVERPSRDWAAPRKPQKHLWRSGLPDERERMLAFAECSQRRTLSGDDRPENFGRNIPNSGGRAARGRLLVTLIFFCSGRGGSAEPQPHPSAPVGRCRLPHTGEGKRGGASAESRTYPSVRLFIFIIARLWRKCKTCGMISASIQAEGLV